MAQLSVLQQDANLIATFFNRDNRFIFRGPVTDGGAATVHRVQYLQQDLVNGGYSVTDYLVKKARNARIPRLSLIDERNYLLQVRGGLHMVQMIDIPQNPLNTQDFDAEWLILEWVPNGTLENFVNKAKYLGITRFPNRLLWRFFLCLIRGICGLAWPRNRHDGFVELELPIPDAMPTTLTHNDLHGGNVLLGNFEVGGEHAITPILKLIDFGNASSDPATRTGLAAARQTNLWDIGKIMVQLITLDMDYDPQDDKPAVNINYLGNPLATRATEITAPFIGGPRPFPWLDEWLETLVAMCMAADLKDVPSLQSLSAWVPYAIVERTEMFYGAEEEDDAFIAQLCRVIILNAT